MVQTNDVTLYERVNEALADELFGSQMAGRPAYVLPENDALTRALSEAGVDAQDPRTDLARVVRGTLYLDPEDEGTGPLRWHVLRSRQHARHRDDTPPSLALLAVLSMAADAMHASDGMSAANYYGRLMDLLEVPEARHSRVQQDYMARAEELWVSLNRWLEVWEGERGIPTAYAVSTRYVGLPMSQALVRQRDREVLPDIFWDEGLPPGYRMAASDMEQVLESWVNRSPSPLSQPLRRLWTNAGARERIVQVACLELESWPGQHREVLDTTSASTRRTGALRLLAFLRTFPRRMLEINLSVPRPGEDEMGAGLLTLQGPEGPVEMPLGPAPMSTFRLSSTAELDAEGLLGDRLVGTVNGSGTPVERRPRRVVPLRWDELQGCHVEVERVELGDDMLLLVVDEMRPKLEPLLEAVSRPGFASLTDVPGLPAGWTLYRDVQVLDAFEGQVHLDLLPLVPRARTSLALSGGFALPGRLRKWSSLEPPEVRATAAAAEKIELQVNRGAMVGDCVWSEIFEGGVVIAPLAPLQLDDGEYLVTMHVDGARKPSATSLLRLRSAETPVQDMTGRKSGLVYVPGSGPLWPFSAQSPDERPFIDGGRLTGFDGRDEPVAPDVAMPGFQPRPRPQRQVTRAATRIGLRMGDESCMRTGKHRIQLPTAGPGRPKTSSIEGECTTCGLVKRYPARGRAKKQAAPAARMTNLLEVPPVETHRRVERVALDALSHVGHGSANDFSRIAAQVESSELFTDTWLRQQELLGHLDVRRDETFRLVEWEMTPPTLVSIGENKWVLVGRRTKGVLRSLSTVVQGLGGRVLVGAEGDNHRVEVVADRSRLGEVASTLEQRGIYLQDEGGALRLAHALPPLSSVEPGLRRVPVPAFRSLEVWDHESATWQPATSLAAVGAYRLRTFAPTYVVRSRADLELGTVGLVTPHLAKHIASAWARDPLAGYHAASSSVVVPLGADVPGLYGRALVLCSGYVPVVAEKSRMLQYRSVPREVADVIHSRLTS